MRRLLILSCSQKKHADPYPMTAGWRYRGTHFAIVRNLKLAGLFPADTEVVILSARLGLIEWGTLIENYNLKMDEWRARSMQQHTCRTLAARLYQSGCEEVFGFLGENYRLAITPESEWLPEGCRLTVPTGGIGTKLAALKRWLPEQRDERGELTCQPIEQQSTLARSVRSDRSHGKTWLPAGAQPTPTTPSTSGGAY